LTLERDYRINWGLLLHLPETEAKNRGGIMLQTMLALMSFLIAVGGWGAVQGQEKAAPLYATMKTGMGDIVVLLFEDKAPKTVENFVGLATGTKEWTDPKSRARTKRPLYNGTIFHRVIPNFMIQGGDPLGNGTGGPGFRFADEFHPELKHSKAGILSMANGGPNTNGSQFFITQQATPWLDGRHSVFGEVVKGQEVVNAIVNVARDGRDRPLKDVVLLEVIISRGSF
jgi:peptidyl-prolyl cis-trans isomerase A (cyclophilin A)